MNHRKIFHKRILLSTLIAVSMGIGYESCQAQPGSFGDREMGDDASQHSSQSHNTPSNEMEESTVLFIPF